jgi:hypothetical protein
MTITPQLLVVMLLFAAVATPFAHVSATGLEADAMCDPVYIQCKCGEDPDPLTGQCKPGGKNKFKCPPGPAVCYDMTNNHMTTGTCDRPKHCLTNTCGGTECKQAKPGEQQQPPEQPKPEDQQGQEQGKPDQKPPQMPEMPKGGGGDKSKPPEQTGKEDCVMSGAIGMPCPPHVSTQLGSNQSATQDPAKLLRALGGGDESATRDTTSSGQQGFLERVKAGAGDFFEKLLARTPEVSDDSAQSQGGVIPTVPGVTFGSPEFGSFSLEPTTVGQRVISWFQNLFK